MTMATAMWFTVAEKLLSSVNIQHIHLGRQVDAGCGADAAGYPVAMHDSDIDGEEYAGCDNAVVHY